MAITETIKNNGRVITIASMLSVFSLFGVFYTFDNIYARTSQVEQVQQSINNKMDQRTIDDLEDKILVIDMKENPTATDNALRKRYQSRLDSLRK